jgi:DNA-binding NtrC family response regulator
LSSAPAIVAIAEDPALLRSVAFALEAHGHKVRTCPTWSAAIECFPGASCVIIDGRLASEERKEFLESLATRPHLVLLADLETPSFNRPDFLVLQKPLAGSDLVSAVSNLFARAT